MANKGIPKQVKAVVTGATSGIGKAVALQLAKEYQATLLINARNEADLQKSAADLKALGATVYTVLGDVSSADTIKSITQIALNQIGGIDLLVNNAGLSKGGPLLNLTVDDWQHVFEVNFFAPLKLTYALLPSMIEKGSGKIVNISSVAGKISFPGSVCYSASKFALTGLSEGLAAEFQEKGIDVITVCPGWVRTEFFKKNALPADPSQIAEEKNVKGWLMRNILSISSEQSAKEILDACQRGGSHEIVQTIPGRIIERIAGVFPQAIFRLASLVPADRQTFKKMLK